MNPEITQLIERYLLNELSQTERQSFELQLAENHQLLQELIVHKQLHEAAKRAAQRNLVQQTAKRYHFRKNVVTSSIVVLVVATVTAITLWSTNRKSDSQKERAEQELVAQLEADKHTPLEHIVAEYFHLNQQDTVVLSKTGVLLSVPEGAFLLNGKPYSGPKMIQWQEAINAADIVKAGLSTFAGEHLLETQGMFALQAFTPDGTKLNVNPEVGVYVQVPVDELKEGMMLFEGKKMNNGIVDWRNPQQLTKLPQMADMKDLDFYPEGYEDKLNNLKWKTGKKERDSLYLSFEDEPEDVVAATVSNSFRPAEARISYPEQIVVDPLRTISDVKSDTTENSLQLRLDKLNDSLALINGVAKDFSNTVFETHYGVNPSVTLIGNNQFYLFLEVRLLKGYHVLSNKEQELVGIDLNRFRLIGGLEEIDTPKTVLLKGKPVLGFEKQVVFRQKVEAYLPQTTFDFNFLYAVYDDGTGEEVQYRGSLSLVGMPFEQLSSAYTSAYNKATISDSISGIETKKHIPPSAVIAFWKPKFNNTILATRDFEKRMKAIHATCDKDVLEAYTDNLNKPLYKIDEQVVKMGHPEFREFAAERVGGVELDNPHMNNLRQYYEGAVSKIRKELKKDRDFVRRQEIAWDNRMQRLRTEESGRTARRQSQNSTEEARFNYEAMVRQLGSKPQIGFTIFSDAPVFNCDRFDQPFYAQRAAWRGGRLRQLSNQLTKQKTLPSMASMYVPPALIVPEYEPFSVSVKNNTDYGKTMVYLFPKQVKSFQRLDGSGGQFNGRLNKGMQYDLLVISIAENGFYLYEETGVDGGQKTITHLEQVSELEFNRRVEAMNANRLDKPMAVFDELEWLTKEQQNYKVQRLRMEREAFRNIIRPIVFPCLNDVVRDEIQI
ncbi:MAG: hypothetical protein A3D31_04320 [Candidatus Fluviicola riflensis]|nr:MAG: hypothetical protein CHH17_10710 [Candidatus Fluviicola riflensis]OGS79201.1 MAG: hypothetical protein A3D31_04320 [Candidatus Fluviicola riflensis]OGS86633.1 MAG: hypothetical protein A2724_03780 [Fluviicola sp. RIFCSPHIGHO2_01_FULL_43_53]OGS88893.1 MAG: hypothetical protein A3E30_00880 [Fluviicola sp. RIFCSPHIGHO2_12_FULL_43_24]